jgi:hypothetical protein
MAWRSIGAPGRQGGGHSMRIRGLVPALVAAGAIAGLALASSSRAAQPYCPNPAHVRPAPPPADLLVPIAKAFDVDAAAVRGTSYVRCIGAALMGCYVGANLVCDRADARRTNPGAVAWCRAHPGAAEIPMAATGHATIYEWSCNGARAVAGKILMRVDVDGYIADNWKEIR